MKQPLFPRHPSLRGRDEHRSGAQVHETEKQEKEAKDDACRHHEPESELVYVLKRFRLGRIAASLPERLVLADKQENVVRRAPC